MKLTKYFAIFLILLAVLVGSQLVLRKERIWAPSRVR